MITQAERAYILERAYVPEHVPAYVAPISKTEPHLIDDCVAYVGGGRLIFIGYPLERSFNTKIVEKSLGRALKRFRPKRINLIGPEVPSSIVNIVSASRDNYYLLDLELLRIPQKVRNMLSRASREIIVAESREFGDEHAAIVDEFFVRRRVEEATRFIFARIPEYVRSSETAKIFEARNTQGKLVAFDVAESGAKEHLFHLFNFSSRTCYIPGASDFLLNKMIGEASVQGKKSLNMGLGIDSGVIFFKTKWGACPTLPYVSCECIVQSTESVRTLLDKL
jgi:hypothetical protein